MILATGNRQSRSSRELLRTPRAFTLIELILVMTLLMIVLAVSAPSLQNFFKGRNLDSEARRIYSLTVYAQSRAVSESIPMLVWFDTKQRTYGLRAASSYLEIDPKSVEFKLDRDLQIEVRNPQLVPGSLATPFVDREIGTLPSIRFSPDGSIVETSPETILVTQTQKDAIALAINTNRLRYEILPGNGYDYRR